MKKKKENVIRKKRQITRINTCTWCQVYVIIAYAGHLLYNFSIYLFISNKSNGRIVRYPVCQEPIGFKE